MEFKYDGSTIRGKHVIRYGVEVNRILGGGFASFLALAPAVCDSYSAADQAAAAASTAFPGGAANPLNYPVDGAFLGNGIGYDTALPEFGFPAGGQFDTRFSWYIGDNWKIRPNLNISLGLHYIRDTGRSDSQLGPNAAINAFGAGLGDASPPAQSEFCASGRNRLGPLEERQDGDPRRRRNLLREHGVEQRAV